MKVSELLDLLPVHSRVLIRDADDNDLEDVDLDMWSYSRYCDFDVGAIVPTVAPASWREPERAILIVRV